MLVLIPSKQLLILQTAMNRSVKRTKFGLQGVIFCTMVSVDFVFFHFRVFSTSCKMRTKLLNTVFFNDCMRSC